MAILVRAMEQGDVAEACALLNEIIAIGGTTAFQSAFDDSGFATAFLTDNRVICCHVALDDAGHVAAFQWLGVNPNLPVDCADIASFARQTDPVKGAGRAMFAVTTKAALSEGYTQINATIRADNAPGLGYYTAMGFRDHDIARAKPLADGTRVDRVSKRFDLTG
ncbi:GNAT family N-acetyltransferase [Falsiphaeobacter marinintestinus]|uniref:GNAT family N-acetyltransferase n=1 Tax=Falsiphaeobacter marinintestinus TaxID=1492905 RepID=UPI0011B4FCC5|nr:GNAT family N-acetyltransferase [Phaeobacter marinintestinus]